MTKPVAIDFENMQVIFMIKALIGNITNTMRGVSIKCNSQKDIEMYFMYFHEEDSMHEDIEDVLFEFEALQSTSINLNVNILYGDRLTDDGVHLDGRMIFMRRA